MSFLFYYYIYIYIFFLTLVQWHNNNFNFLSRTERLNRSSPSITLFLIYPSLACIVKCKFTMLSFFSSFFSFHNDGYHWKFIMQKYMYSNCIFSFLCFWQAFFHWPSSDHLLGWWPIHEQTLNLLGDGPHFNRIS